MQSGVLGLDLLDHLVSDSLGGAMNHGGVSEAQAQAPLRPVSQNLQEPQMTHMCIKVGDALLKVNL